MNKCVYYIGNKCTLPHLCFEKGKDNKGQEVCRKRGNIDSRVEKSSAGPKATI